MTLGVVVTAAKEVGSVLASFDGAVAAAAAALGGVNYHQQLMHRYTTLSPRQQGTMDIARLSFTPPSEPMRAYLLVHAR